MLAKVSCFTVIKVTIIRLPVSVGFCCKMDCGLTMYSAFCQYSLWGPFIQIYHFNVLLKHLKWSRICGSIWQAPRVHSIKFFQKYAMNTFLYSLILQCASWFSRNMPWISFCVDLLYMYIWYPWSVQFRIPCKKLKSTYSLCHFTFISSHASITM